MFYYKNAFAISIIIHISFILFIVLDSKNSKNFDKQQNTMVLEVLQLSNNTNVPLKNQENNEIIDNAKKSFRNNTESYIDNIQDFTNNSEISNEYKDNQYEKIPIADQNSKIIKNDKNIIQKLPVIKSKPRPYKVQEDKTKNKVDDFSSLFKTIENTQDNNYKSKSNLQNGINGLGDYNFDNNNDVSQNIIDYIRTKFVGCWIVPIKLKNIQNREVTLRLKLSKNGKLISVYMSRGSDKDLDHIDKILVESAKRAIYTCAPIEGITQYPYKLWNEIDITFFTDEII